MSWMSPRANALVDAARVEMSPDAERAARMRARIMAATGGAAIVGAAVVASQTAAPATATTAATATTTTATTATTVAGMSLATKLALGLLGVAAVATGTHMIDRMMMRAPAPAAPAPQIITKTETRVVHDPSIVAAPVPVPIVFRFEIAAPRARAKASAPSDLDMPADPVRVVSADDQSLVTETPPTFDQGADALARELSQVRGAQAALRGGDGATALVALDAHDRDFPAGQLAEEAGVLRIEALCAVGRTIDASDARGAFLSRWPRSAQRARAERGCGGDPPR
ncbi:MAG TPA: hypothetical protein VL463_06430 [Kofleriaceae bacterium]|nr:hypothetical protein [Kofleriaceae bacterium]